MGCTSPGFCTGRALTACAWLKSTISGFSNPRNGRMQEGLSAQCARLKSLPSLSRKQKRRCRSFAELKTRSGATPGPLRDLLIKELDIWDRRADLVSQVHAGGERDTSPATSQRDPGTLQAPRGLSVELRCWERQLAALQESAASLPGECAAEKSKPQSEGVCTCQDCMNA